jgi:hypothetical protein
LEQDTAGDPITGLKWTHKTTEKIAQQLQFVGIQVGRSTVARLLDDLDYALRVNQKKRAGASSPDRNEQFLFIKTCATGSNAKATRSSVSMPRSTN